MNDEKYKISRTDPKMDTFAQIPANPEMYLK